MKLERVLVPVIALLLAGCGIAKEEYQARLTEIDGLKRDVAKAAVTVKDKDGEIADQKAKIWQLEDALAKKEAARDAIEKELAAQKSQNEQLAASRELSRKEAADLRSTLDASKGELSQKLSASTKENESLRGEVAAKMAEVETKSKLASEKDARIAELAASKTDLDAQVAKLKAEIADLRHAREIEVAKSANELKSRDDMAAELKREIALLSTEKAQAIDEKERQIAEMRKAHDGLVAELSTEIRKGEIAVTQLKDKLTLQMVEKILFDSGSADIKTSGKAVLVRVASVLKKIADRQIRIEGHTDNVPVGPKIAKKFPTNWELSTARATNVVRYLKEKGAIDPKYLSAIGYAEHKPVASNDTDEGRAANRRIDIVLVPVDREPSPPPAGSKQ